MGLKTAPPPALSAAPAVPLENAVTGPFPAARDNSRGSQLFVQAFSLALPHRPVVSLRRRPARTSRNPRRDGKSDLRRNVVAGQQAGGGRASDQFPATRRSARRPVGTAMPPSPGTPVTGFSRTLPNRSLPPRDAMLSPQLPTRPAGAGTPSLVALEPGVESSRGSMIVT